MRVCNRKVLQVNALRNRIVPVLLAAASLLLSGCSVPKLWPFGSDEGRTPVPENATRYVCDANKGFYLRTLAGGSLWVILAEREFRVDLQGGSGSKRYGNGVAVLDMSEAAVTLTDGPAAQFAGCKAAEAK
jgi:hypothetical protein